MGRTEKECVVVNASVMLAVFLLDEPWLMRGGAMRLLHDIRFEGVIALVPDRFRDEVVGGLLGAVSVQRPPFVPADEAFQMLNELPLIWCREGEVWQPTDVWALAQTAQCTYPYAMYVQLARQQNATLWTADLRLVRHLRSLYPVGWIGDYLLQGV